MRLNKIGANVTLIEKGDLTSTQILFSYETPVAMNWKGSGYTFVADVKYSNTTTKHINSWLKDNTKELGVKEVPQSWFENYV
jgi:hypothetical protein